MNTGALWPSPDEAEQPLRMMQTKLHQWAIVDSGRCFDDLFDVVYHPAFVVTDNINSGISNDVITALLGHKTLAMTMVYARIAGRTVADENFAATGKVKPLYEQPHQIRADDEGSEMRRLRAEMRRRMLDSGYCARPVEMDYHVESICEPCLLFVTTVEFKPTLRRQRDAAAGKGELDRQKIFDRGVERLNEPAS